MERFDPSKVVVIWDGGKSARRMALHEGYKASRGTGKTHSPIPNDPDGKLYKQEFYNQNKIVNDILPNLGVVALRLKGREADDIVWWSRQLIRDSGDSREAVIMSEDRDFYQMVDDTTDLYMPVKDMYMSLGNFFTIAEVPIERFLIYKSILGDKGDDIGGISGIGDKTAKMIANNAVITKDIKDIKNVLESLRQWCAYSNDKRAQKLTHNIDIVWRNYQLVHLGSEVLEEDEKEAILSALKCKQSLDLNFVLRSFRDMQFHSILKNWYDFTIPFRRLGTEGVDNG